MTVYWIRCQNDSWCLLNTVNLSHNHFNNLRGVYIIWHGGIQPQTVRVGQGFIRDRLTAHRTDPQVQTYANQTLYVTWTSLPLHLLDGVEAYLAANLNPKENYRFPTATPISVNLPW